ncbi:MAG: hypothetical protein MJA29_10910, partial [Candidatus Omnitrophica bacterium]|nr:hypothetical protein [Candidatus Omnitrophota bacterium]
MAPGWKVGSSSRPGAPEDVRHSYVAGLPGRDVQSSMHGPMGRSNADRGPEGSWKEPTCSFAAQLTGWHLN